MSESVEEFLSRGGKIDVVDIGERKYKTFSQMLKSQKKAQSDSEYEEWSQKQDENETECRKTL